MIHIGIDFSLNSPAVCVQKHNGEYRFFSFFNYGNRLWDDEKTPKAFEVHKELSDNETILAFPYNREVDNKDFLLRERQKLDDAHTIADLISGILITFYGTTDVKIGLEGFSYGSKGNSFIDIVQYNSFLRAELRKAYGSAKISVFQPSHVKKLAGKGNANKHYMVKAFQDDVLNDSELRKTKFWNWCKDKDFSEKIPKPVDDLVDSYFILKSIQANQ